MFFLFQGIKRAKKKQSPLEANFGCSTTTNQRWSCASVTYDDAFAPPTLTFAPVPEKSSPPDHDVVAFASEDTAGEDDEGFAQSGSPYAPLMIVQ